MKKTEKVSGRFKKHADRRMPKSPYLQDEVSRHIWQIDLNSGPIDKQMRQRVADEVEAVIEKLYGTSSLSL